MLPYTNPNKGGRFVFKPIYNRITALLTVAFLTFTFALGGTVLAIINMGDNLGASPFTTALFSGTGEINAEQAANILANMSGESVLNQNSEFRLFSDTGAATTDVGRLSRLNWRMVNIDGDRVTFYASGAYRNSVFNSTSGAGTQVYRNSALRAAVLHNFTQLTTGWTPSVVNANILQLGANADSMATYDRIWLPRTEDVQNGGAWGLNATSRSFAQNGFNENAWLRTATRVGTTVQTTEWRAHVIDQMWAVWPGEYSWEGYGNFGAERLAPGAEGIWSVTVPRAAGTVIDTRLGCVDENCHTMTSVRTIITRHESRLVPLNTPATAAAVSSTGVMRTGVADNIVVANLAVRPALHISLSQLQSAVELAPLFDEDGEMNPSVVADILANINNGNVVNRMTEFRLFSDTGAANTNVRRLSELNWRMTNVDGDRVTFWASGAYRNSQFNNTTGTNAERYNQSNIQANINSDFNALTSAWNVGVRNASIRTLDDSSDWGVPGDRMWLPRTVDIQNGGTWGLNIDAREFEDNGFNSNAWLRTPTQAGRNQVIGQSASWVVDTQWWQADVDYGGHFSGWLWPIWDESLPPAGQHTVTTEPTVDGWIQSTTGNRVLRVMSIVSHISAITPVTPIVATAATVSTLGSMATGAATNPVNQQRSVRPAINICLAVLTENEPERDRGSLVFETPANVILGDDILMNTLFPTQVDYRSKIRVGDWVKSTYGNHPVIRRVDAIGGGANPTVTLGLTIKDIFEPAEGLAELVSYVLSLNLTRADFDSNADWNTFTRALFYAENAIHNLDNLTASELEDISDALRDALDLRN